MLESLDDVFPFVLCALGSPLVVWSWARWRGRPRHQPVVWRTYATMVTLGIVSVSAGGLLVFPGVLYYIEAHQPDLWETWLRAGTISGLIADVLAAGLALFAVAGQRLLLLAASSLLIILWAVVGILGA